jgi:hypothetical protein
MVLSRYVGAVFCTNGTQFSKLFGFRQEGQDKRFALEWPLH